MLYLNSNVQPGAHLRTLLAHEFTHAVCFSERLPSDLNPRGLADEEDWLNEAIAHISENKLGRGWSNLDYRISRFLNEPHAFPLVVSDYYRARLWRNHGCRGATYLFLRWCVDQHGDQILKQLVANPVGGTRNLEWATGIPFEELYRRWSLALYQSGRRIRLESTLTTELRLDSTANPLETDVFQDSSPESSHAQSNGHYSSLDLRGRLSNWALAGPRPVVWDIDSGNQSLSLRGTSTAFVEVHANRSVGPARIRLRADYGTRLQVSVIKIAGDWPTLSARAEWVNPSEAVGGTSVSRGTQEIIRVHVAGTAAENLVVEQIGCERHQGQFWQSVCFAGANLIERKIEVLAVASPADNGAGISECYQLPLSSKHPADTDILVKVVARDARGRRVTAWANLEAPPTHELRITEHSAENRRQQ